MSGGPEGDFEWLGSQLLLRREHLGMTQEDVRAAGGPGTVTMRQIESGRPQKYQGMVKRKVEHALKLPVGAFDDLLAGRPLSEVVAAERGEAIQRTSSPDPLDEQLGLPLRDEHGDPICDEDGAPLTIARILSTIRYVTRQEGVEAGRRSLRDMGNRFGLPLAREHDRDLLGDSDMHRVV